MNGYAIAWAGIIAFCIIMYVTLDGFTLGTGILLPLMSKTERDIAMSVILPNWDGNQTWLVLSVASLYGAFPPAFSYVMPILYVPLLIMVLALLFRGVVFEFRLKSDLGQARWDKLFFFASLVATLIQGTILGNVIKGFGGGYHVLSPFSWLTALLLVFGYSTLGSTRLILKTQGTLRSKMSRLTPGLATGLGLSIIAASLASLTVHPSVRQLWLHAQNWPLLVITPTITLLLFALLVIGLKQKTDYLPYCAMVGIFLCCYAGFGLDIFPYVVPYKITLFQAASPPSTLKFILIGACIMLPVLLFYTGYSYHIFRGKTHETLHY